MKRVLGLTDPSFWSVRGLFASAAVLRILLLVFGILQDQFSRVRYTDVDYLVFTQAAQHVNNGDSPFLSPTYRYTPLLAIVFRGNLLVHEAFGKILFVAFDILVGYVIHISVESKSHKEHLGCLSLWFLNPITLAISTRGNADVIVCLLSVLSLYYYKANRFILAGFWLGFAVHFKIYPIIYLLSMVLIILRKYQANRGRKSWPYLKSTLIDLSLLLISTLTSFILFTGAMYILYGYEYLDKALLYHFRRTDTRHNFSPYFYMMYLNPKSSIPLSVVTFLPQAFLLLVTGMFLPLDIHLHAFCQTMLFVAFNKVCTSQYFVWFLVLLPFISSKIPNIFSREGLMILVFWLIGQGLWLLPAYFLEFEGVNTFLWIWLAGLAFLAIQTYIVSWIITHYKPPTSESIKHD